MSLLRLYRLAEAGISQLGTAKKPKKKSGFKHANGMGNVQLPDDHEDDDKAASLRNGTLAPAQDPEWESGWKSSEDDDELGPDVDYDDPAEPDSDGDDVPDEPEKKATSPFSSKSAPPSKALQGGQPGVSIKADKATLKALARAFDSVRTNDDDLQDWVDDCIREIERATKSDGGSLTLPKFEATPDLDDDFNDGGPEDEDY